MHMPALSESKPQRKHNQKTSKGRYVFHEQALRDQKHLTKYAIALAGFIMHEYATSEGVSFRISLRRAARFLGTKKRELLQDARDLLVQRGHLIAVKEQAGVKGKRNQPGLYFFGNGPAGGMAPAVGATTTEEQKERESTERFQHKNLKHESLKHESGNRHGAPPDRVLPLVAIVSGGRR
jgi:hypothetical protein